MGKGKKKFIEKGDGQHFHVMHRSQRDEAYMKEEEPSNFVLVPTSDTHREKASQLGIESIELHASKALETSKDHINALGFKNDGYDYTQHLKVIAGGSYLNKEGKVVERIAPALPDDVFASEHEMERNYQAITISEEFMDPDIRAALFEDEDDEGGFEALDDDFVMQVMQEPEKPDFDFEAHIARLIELSEKAMMGDDKVASAARGWDDPKLKGRFLRRKNHEDDEDNEFGDDDDEISEGDFDLDEEYEDDDQSGQQRGGCDEEGFEKVLEEYEDEQLGYIEDDDEEAVEGTIDITAGESELLNAAIEEFLAEQKDSQLYDGLDIEKVQENKVRIAKFRSHIEDSDSKEKAMHDKAQRENAIRREYLEQVQSQEISGAEYPQFRHNVRKALTDFQEPEIDKIELDEIFEQQEYLRQTVPKEQWDCETILSTYSTLDNHPTVIKDPKSKFKPYVSRFQRQQLREEEDADGGQGDTRTVQSRSTVAHSVRSRQDSFAKKFSSSSAVRAETDSHVDRQSDLVAQYTQKLAALSLARSGVSTVATFVKKIPAPVHEEEGEDENSCDDESSNEEGDGWVERTNQPTGRKAETKEEKKLRKQAVKEERRTRRVAKKELKEAFKSEMLQIGRTGGPGEKLGVYKY